MIEELSDSDYLACLAYVRNHKSYIIGFMGISRRAFRRISNPKSTNDLAELMQVMEAIKELI
jgi:hypothetical protein